MIEKKRKVIIISPCVITSRFKSRNNSLHEELEEIVKLLFNSETEIIQLPCPHLLSIIASGNTGFSKKDIVKTFIEGNNNNDFTNLYGQMLAPIILEVERYRKQGIDICGLIGVKGSPSCSVNMAINNSDEDCGAFMKALVKGLNENSLTISMVDI